MKLLTSILLSALLAYAAGLYLPWWSAALAAFLVALMLYQRPPLAALAGFVGLLLLWGFISWTRSSSNEHILAHRISQLILKKDSPALLIALTALIGAVTGALGALSGSLARKAFKPEPPH